MDGNAVREGVRLILEGLGLELDGNFVDTPDRVARAYLEIFQGLQDTDEQVERILSKTFPCNYSAMIAVKDIESFGLCPHHLLPVRYSICAAYIPSENGRVLGISKIARLADLLARRPVLHEQLVEDVTSSLMKLKGCIGSACIARAEHFCMIMRGTKQPHAVVVASSLKGAFLDDPTVRAEFMGLTR